MVLECVLRAVSLTSAKKMIQINSKGEDCSLVLNKVLVNKECLEMFDLSEKYLDAVEYFSKNLAILKWRNEAVYNPFYLHILVEKYAYLVNNKIFYWQEDIEKFLKNYITMSNINISESFYKFILYLKGIMDAEQFYPFIRHSFFTDKPQGFYQTLMNLVRNSYTEFTTEELIDILKNMLYKAYEVSENQTMKKEDIHHMSYLYYYYMQKVKEAKIGEKQLENDIERMIFVNQNDKNECKILKFPEKKGN